jgi:Protein of unknown function (DUF2865)
LGVRLRSLTASFLAGALGLALAVPGPAAAQTCFNMQAEMMQLRARSTGFNDSARYDRAYREQADVIARTEARMRDDGCFGGFLFFRRTPQQSCNTLIPKLHEMQQNLARLDQMRSRGGGDSYRMRELEGMMAAAGCALPGGNVYQTQPDDNWFFRQNPYYSAGGTYRTLCVRTCDGYYFPISFSTTSDRFQDDAQICASMCPGSEAMLYYYPNPGGGPEDMVSINGEPYSALPTAFKYRTSLEASCTCKPAGGYQTTVAQSVPQSLPAPGAAIDLTAPLPIPRPAPGEDPETLADRAGGFVPRANTQAESGTPVATNAGEHPIRVVGPSLGNAAQDALVISPVPN